MVGSSAQLSEVVSNLPYGENHLKGDSIVIISTTSLEARAKALCNTHMLLSTRAQQLAANIIRSRVPRDRKFNLPAAVGPRPFDSKLRTALDGLAQAPLLEW